MNTKEIRNWISTENLLDQTFQGFWISMSEERRNEIWNQQL